MPNEIQSFNSKHQLMLYMCLAGMKTKDIAQKLGYHPNRVSTIRNSPLFVSQLEALQQQLHDDTLGDFLERIRTELLPNFDFLVSLRDNSRVMDGVRLSAAKEILTQADRIYPRTTRHEEERVIKISLEGRHLKAMADVLSEYREKPVPIQPDYEEVREAELIGEVEEDLKKAEAAAYADG